MFNVKLTVIASEKWEKEGKKYNSLTVTALGHGVFKLTVKEEILPDIFDGKEFVAQFGLGIDRKTFRPYLKFIGVE